MANKQFENFTDFANSIRAPKIPDSKIVFGFKYFDNDDENFNTRVCDGDYFNLFFARLKELENINFSELKNTKAFNFHEIKWSETCRNGFCINVPTEGNSRAYQFSIHPFGKKEEDEGNKKRVYGFVKHLPNKSNGSDDIVVFQVIWLDPMHCLYG